MGSRRKALACVCEALEPGMCVVSRWGPNALRKAQQEAGCTGEGALAVGSSSLQPGGMMWQVGEN